MSTFFCAAVGGVPSVQVADTVMLPEHIGSSTAMHVSSVCAEPSRLSETEMPFVRLPAEDVISTWPTPGWPTCPRR